MSTKRGTRLSSFFAVVIVALCALTFFLAQENNSYKEQNRALLLQNDSIQSVNLKLMRSIDLNATKTAARLKP